MLVKIEEVDVEINCLFSFHQFGLFVEMASEYNSIWYQIFRVQILSNTNSREGGAMAVGARQR